MKKFLIIDGNSLVNRAFYAIPLLSNSRGEYSNAVFGFINILTKAIQEQKPDYIAVAFDFGRKTFRHDIYSEYKATRKGMPTELGMQMPILKDVLKTMNIKCFEMENIEADDIIGSLSQVKGVNKLLLSGDRDLFQLIDKETSVWFPRKGISEIDLIDTDSLYNITGLTPSQIVDYKALRGDSSDNIPGVAGIGEKGATTLLQKYNSLKSVYENLDDIKGKLKENLINGKELAYISYDLATIKTDIDLNFKLEDCKYTFPYDKQIFDIFKKYEFNSILKRKDIFEKDVIEADEQESKNYSIIKITSKNELSKVVKYIKEEKRIAFDFSSNPLKVASSPNFLYVFEQEISMFSDTLPIDEVLQELKDVFKSEKIDKVCLDLKKHKHLLEKFNVELGGDIFDISVANYLVGNERIDEIECTKMFYLQKDLILKMKDLGVYDLYKNVETPLIDVLFSMENSGILVNVKELEVLENALKEELFEMSAKVQSLAGEPFNINSPKQLSNILFNKLKLPIINNKKLSTNVEVLTNLEHHHEIIPLLLRYRKIQKLLTTYVESFRKIAENNNGYIHTIFNQTLTSTGRLSSSEPNLQNIPIRDIEGRQLRKVFISRFEKGNLISADYNQIELRLMAHYSQDENLVGAYKRNEDIHSRTASSIFGLPLESITAEQRRLAKTVNFGIIYGISDYGLSQSLGTSVARAKKYIEKYFEVFPGVKKYINQSVELAKSKGYASTLFGRIRFIPELNSPNFAIKKFGERVAMNMPLQGSASDIIKIAMINIYKKLKEKNMKTQIILQIHDELVLDSPADEINSAIKILKEEMESVANLSVALPIDISFGKNLLEC